MPVSVTTRGLKERTVKKRPIRNATCAVLQAEGLSLQCEVSILLTDDATIQDLNRRYLHRDHPTDVIAFHQSERDELPALSEKRTPRQPPTVLGDIVISAETAQKQAEEYGLSLEQEISLLTIHGVLHLLGYEDETPSRKRKMHARQREILASLYPELRTHRTTKRTPAVGPPAELVGLP